MSHLPPPSEATSQILDNVTSPLELPLPPQENETPPPSPSLDLDTVTVADQVFHNCLIARAILKHCKTRDILKNIRRLTKTFQLEGTKLIQSLNFEKLIIKFEYNHDEKLFTFFQNSSQSLNQLNTILAKSTIFPCLNFAFNGGFINEPTFKNFIKINGGEIKFLHLDFPLDVEPTIWPTLTSFLSQNLPNLTHLSIDEIRSDWLKTEEDLSSSSNNVQLKIVDLNVPPCGETSSRPLRKLTRELLKNCRHLRSFQNFDPAHLQEFLNLPQKVYLIKEFTLVGRHTDNLDDDDEAPARDGTLVERHIIDNCGPGYLNIFENFLNYAPQLEKIIIEGSCHPSLRVTNLWQKLLQTCAPTLKELNLTANQNLAPIFPAHFKLPQIKILTLRDFLVELGNDLIDEELNLTCGVDLATNFGGVSQLNLIVFDDDEDFDNLTSHVTFYELPCMPWVRELSLDGAKWCLDSKMTLLDLTQSFQGVKKLTLKVMIEHVVGDDFPNIFEWTEMEDLTLILVANDQDFGYNETLFQDQDRGVGFTYPVLDSPLIGIGEEECKNMRGIFEKIDDISELRRGRSILDMQNLERFRIELKDANRLEWVNYDDYRQHEFPISEVAALYGFQLLPKLHFYLKIDANCFGPQDKQENLVQLEKLREFLEIQEK